MDYLIAETRGAQLREAPVSHDSGVDIGAVRARWQRMNFNNLFNAALEASVEDGEREGWPETVPFIDYSLVERARVELGEQAAYSMDCAFSADPG